MLSDWVNHVGTIFPEVRLKRYLEMRGADSGPLSRIVALPALFVGLLYDDGVLDAAYDLVKDWTAEERQKLRDDVPKLGFKAEIRGITVHELARQMLTLARTGLRRRDRLDMNGCDETRYLDPIQAIVDEGRTAAEALIEKYLGPWQGQIDRVFEEQAY